MHNKVGMYNKVCMLNEHAGQWKHNITVNLQVTQAYTYIYIGIATRANEFNQSELIITEYKSVAQIFIHIYCSTRRVYHLQPVYILMCD